MLIVLDSESGQMCNQMLMQMNVLASAYKHSYNVLYYGFKRYNGPVYSAESLNNIICEKEDVSVFQSKIAHCIAIFCKKLHIKNSRIILGDDSESVRNFLDSNDIRTKRYWCIGWPFYDLDSLRENADLIREFYAPNREIKGYIGTKLSKYDTNDVTVGVHMRRGDYRSWRGGEFYFDDSVYKNYMDELSRKLYGKRIQFILFSNEPIEIQHFESKEYRVDVADGTAMQDFYLMSNCDYIIGPPSSYNGLASFLGNTPRFIVLNDNEELEINKMHVWLKETDGWVNPI